MHTPPSTLLKEQLIGSGSTTKEYINTYPIFVIPYTKWEQAAAKAAKNQYRFSSIFAQDLISTFQITMVFEYLGEYVFMRTHILPPIEKIASISNYFPIANRMERHIHDMFGIDFLDVSDIRRWTRHQAWKENEFPLRKNFPTSGNPISLTPPDCDYNFHKIHGEGIYEIPVGPIHAGIIEPGHFRFQVAGEDIFSLEERLGYVHKGIEKIAEGRDVNALIKLAGRVSGDSTVAHSWAACKACESAYNFQVPERAIFLRGILAERERIANHLGDCGAICNDVGFSFGFAQLMRLKELWLRKNKEFFGHRLLMNCLIAGGIKTDLSNQNKDFMQAELQFLDKELQKIFQILEDNSSLHDRIKTTGKLNINIASHLGALGYVGRASGLKFDVRQNASYPPYDKLQINVPTYKHGDVLARMRVRAQEIFASLKIIGDLINLLPSGPINHLWQNPKKSAEGIGVIEGWRGEILTYVNFDNNGLVERFFPRDPSWFNWPALEDLIHGNIVPDFPVCNKSVNGSYSAVDL